MAAPVLFKKHPRSRNIRKRDIDDAEDGEGPLKRGRGPVPSEALEIEPSDDIAAIKESLQKQHTPLSNPMIQGTRKSGNGRAYTQDVAVEAAKLSDTSGLDAQDRAEEDAKQAYARQLARENAEEAADGVYRGSEHYRSYVAPKEQRSSKIRSGPIRDIALNTRTTTVVDYQPAVCKDYKNTGFCGRGDTCIFLHDRSDVLRGWELDAAWEKQKEDAINGVGPDSKDGKGQFYIGDSDDEGEDLPFACLICKKEFTKPVMTRCGHYFCQACALKRFAKTPKCFACSAPTSGIFNRAKVLEKRLEEKKMRRGDDDVGENEVEALDGIEGLG